ncbi:unnamed protein product, partial [Rotaria sp. Silwood1]
FSLKKSEDDDNNDKHSDDNSTVMDESKFDWEYLSNPIDCSNKSSTNLFENYQKTTNLNETNSNEQSSTNYVPSLFENDRLRQHNYCEDLRHDAQSTMIIKQDSTKSIPSHFFSPKKSEDDDNNDKHSDDNSTVMDESKFDWEYLSNPI